MTLDNSLLVVKGHFWWFLGSIIWLPLFLLSRHHFCSARSVPHSFFSQSASICFRDYILNGRSLFTKALSLVQLSLTWIYLYIGIILSFLDYNLPHGSWFYNMECSMKNTPSNCLKHRFHVTNTGSHWQFNPFSVILIKLGPVIDRPQHLFSQKQPHLSWHG